MFKERIGQLFERHYLLHKETENAIDDDISDEFEKRVEEIANSSIYIHE